MAGRATHRLAVVALVIAAAPAVAAPPTTTPPDAAAAAVARGLCDAMIAGDADAARRLLGANGGSANLNADDVGGRVRAVADGRFKGRVATVAGTRANALAAIVDVEWTIDGVGGGWQPMFLVRGGGGAWQVLPSDAYALIGFKLTAAEKVAFGALAGEHERQRQTRVAAVPATPGAATPLAMLERF